jgi:serine/threonine protein kinase
MAPQMHQLLQKQISKYDGRKLDIYAMGITLLVITLHIKLISRASEDDLMYRHIIKGNYNIFWNEAKGMLKAHYQTDDLYYSISEEFKDLINNMISFKESKRFNIDQIKAHPWMRKKFKMHATRKSLIEKISVKLGENNHIFTKNDYLKAVDCCEKENNGEVIKNFDSMKHLV